MKCQDCHGERKVLLRKIPFYGTAGAYEYEELVPCETCNGTGDAPERYVEAIAQDAASEVERSLPYYLDTETRAQITAAVTAAVKSVLEG